MKAGNLVCWKCGVSVAELPLPLSRLAECPACRAYLHVCSLCLNFDRNAPRQCHEQDAEEVKDKERPNFCDYFQPNPNCKGDPKSQSAKSSLDALFGGNADETQSRPDVTRKKLDELFGKGEK